MNNTKNSHQNHCASLLCDSRFINTALMSYIIFIELMGCQWER